MRSLVKGLVFAAVGMALLVPVGLTLVAVGIPLLVVGAVALAVMAVAAVVVSLPVVIVGAAMIGLIAGIFGLFAVILGLGFLALKLAMIVGLIVFAFRLVGRLLFGAPARQRAIAEPVPDRYDREAERELDRELGVQGPTG